METLGQFCVEINNELLLFELANASNVNTQKSTGSKQARPVPESKTDLKTERTGSPDKSYAEVLAMIPESLSQVLVSLEDYTLSLGDDVQFKELRLYTAFKRIKNFATVVLQKSKILLYLHIDPKQITSALPIARDMTEIGHWGTGDVEIPLITLDDLDSVKPFIQAAYEGRATK